jgi:predicted nucleic-acid-binding Zn-ribbon protein
MLVRFKVVRTEVWFPEYEVPSNLADEDILEYIANECPDSVYDEMYNKDTLDTDIDIDLVEVREA